MTLLTIAAWLLLSTPAAAAESVVLSASDEEYKEIAARLKEGVPGVKRYAKEVVRWVNVHEAV